MEKTAAMNKLAHAVREYVQAEAQFNKVAAVAQQYAMEKNAQNILQRLGLQAAPVKSNMGRNAALAALLLGGAGAGAYGMMGRGKGEDSSSLGVIADALAPMLAKIQSSPNVINAAGQQAAGAAGNMSEPIMSLLRNITGQGVNASSDRSMQGMGLTLADMGGEGGLNLKKLMGGK